jgi:hypothetical protein
MKILFTLVVMTLLMFPAFTSSAQERQPLPLGTEPIRDDAACDNPDAWESLMLESPYFHEYTVYQGTVTVDGDTSDPAWQAIPWTICDVWDSGEADVPTVITFWEEFDDIWTSWEDKKTSFKWLWNEDEGALYLLVKDIDDFNVLGMGAYDDYEGVGTGGTLWQGDCVELGFAPYEDGLPPSGRVWSYEGYFVDVDGDVRYWPVAESAGDEVLELLDGDSPSYFEETAEKAIHLKEDGDIRIYEMAIQLLTGMEVGEVWAWGMQVDEADEETGGNNRQGTIKFGMGKRDTDTWSSMLFSADSVQTSVAQKPTAQEIANYVLGDNYPNPFNPTTTINYQLQQKAVVTLTVFDVAGKKIAELVNDVQAPGSYAVSWDASEHASGLYVYQLQANDFRMSKSMLLLK